MTDLEYYDCEIISKNNGDEIIAVMKGERVQVIIRERLLGTREVFTTFYVKRANYNTDYSTVRELLKTAPKVTGLAYHSDSEFCEFIAARYDNFAIYNFDKWQASEFINSQLIIT